MWRDEHGKALSDYSRPSVAVDVALLAVVSGGLAVLLHRPDSGYAAGRWCLPGTFVHENELLAAAALRAVRDKAGVEGANPRQLRVFDALGRDERGRVMSVAHVDLVRTPVVGDRAALVSVSGDGVRPPGRRRGLPFDHDEIVAAALDWARAAHRRSPDPAGLLEDTFTLLELQRLHAAVVGSPLVKDTFRRSMLPHLEPTGLERVGTVGRPAALYRVSGRP
ncbi:MAG: NUDIX domain-containing protein [Actinomycetota bacterium]|nr:NUDIX domain-containing protein [Actinomycetota bacterium]